MSVENLKKSLPRKLSSMPATLGALARATFDFASDVYEFARLVLPEIESAQNGPRSMSTTQREAYVPAGGTALVFDTDLNALCVYVPGAGWHSLDMTAL